MRKTVLLLFLAGLTLHTHAQITSTFDTDADGWTFLSTATSIPVTHQPTGGNPGGYASATYASNISFTTQNWIAPAKFLGNHLVHSLGMNLKFDLQRSHAGTVGGYDVRIENGGTYIFFSLPAKPAVAPAWSSYTLSLDELTAWYYNGGAVLATRAQIKSILANVTSIEIRGTYATNASYTSGLDNVVLEQRTITLAPTITSFVPASAKPGESVVITGNGFDPVLTNNAVYFDNVSAGITNANATQLTVTVPESASSGKITVINKTTGLSIASVASFSPMFDGGGRIIPASFGTRVDFPLEMNHKGATMADIDGDGWIDLAVASNSVDEIHIYRNMATGGPISVASFSSKITIALPGSGTNGTGIAFADLNGDGLKDMISSTGTSAFASAFVTYRNISTPGNIAFDPPEFWGGGSDETPISYIADLDGDGRPELMAGEGAMCGCVRTDFWFVQNLSTPTDIDFGPSQGFFNNSVISGFSGAASGDLDGDGKSELIISNGQGARINVLRNISTPGIPRFENTFSLPVPYTIAADMNLDGKNDLIWKSGATIVIRLNTNTGGALAATDFATEVIIPGEISIYGGLTIADMNGDGRLDILATDAANIGFYENVFDGGVFDASAFVPAYRIEGGGNSSYPGSPMVGDLNHDGKADMFFATTNTSPLRFSFFENKNVHAPVISLNTVSPLQGAVGSTVTITGHNFSTVPAENKVWFGAVQATVLTAAENMLTVRVPAGAGYAPVSVTKNELSSSYHLPFSTTFSSGVTFDNTHFAPPISFTLAGATFDIEVGDLDNDGKPDILGEGGGNFTTRFLNTHSSGAISTSSLTSSGSFSNSYNSRVSDLDGDGLLDIVGLNHVRRNNSTLGTISFLADISLGIGAAEGSFGDFNKDGKTDIAFTNAGGSQLMLIENRTANVSGNFSTGPFASFTNEYMIAKAGTGGSLVSADFDGDGFTDVITTNSNTDNISIFRNLGLPKISVAQFATRVDVAAGDYPYYIYTGDFDTDGKVDVLVLHYLNTTNTLLIVFRNESTVGNIQFNRIDLTNPSSATTAHIADLDGDGKPEIITTSEAGNRFSIFKNLHTAGALSAASFGTPFNTTVTAPRGIIAGDLNLDGKPEIIVTRAAGFLLVYENLVPTVTITITQQPQSSAVCENQTASFSTDATGTTNILYQWQIGATSAGPFTPINNGGGYSNANTKTLSVNTTGNFGAGFYRCRITGDLASMIFTNPAELVITPIPAAPGVTPGSSCGAGNVLLTASGGTNGNYRWYTVPAGGQAIGGEVNSAYTTPSLAATTTYYVSLVNGICEGARTAVIATIVTIPQKPIITASTPLVNNALTICSTSSCTLSAPAGFNSYLWSTGATTSQITVSATGNYSVTVTASGCTSPASDIASITVVTAPCTNQAPAINTTALSTTIGGSVSTDVLALISDDDNNIVPSSLTIVQQPQSGATVTLVNGMMTIDYQNNPFVGTDVVTLQVCDVFGECAQRQFSIDVIGDIEVFNGISANNDLQNDKFIIEHIEKLDDTRANQVTIYNRWGNVVFEMTDYNNDDRVFTGYNKSGNELPSGTYYYKIQFASGRKSESGYLVIKR